MRNIGNLTDFLELQAIMKAIFSKVPRFELPNGTKLRTRLFKDGKVCAVDYGGKRYVSQNPDTSSAYAERARKGIEIAWVLQTHARVKDATGKDYLVPCESVWLGRIEGDTVYMK